MTRLTPIRTVAPAAAILSVAAAKSHLRVAHSEDDSLVEAYVAAVTSHLDAPLGVLRVALLEQTWRDSWSGFPSCGALNLSVLPVRAVTSVEYWAPAASAWAALDPSHWWLVASQAGTCVQLASGSSWPDTADRPEAVRVTYTAGLAAAADDLPAAIMHATKLLVGHWYENREAVTIGQMTTSELPFAVRALLAPWMRLQG